MKEFIQWLENKMFFTCPASINYHGNFPGGLAAHCINVYLAYIKLCENFSVKYDDDSIFLAAILHDLCKLDMYKTFGNMIVFNGGCSASDGHGKISARLAVDLLEITSDESQMIKYHMGIYTKDYNINEVKKGFSDIKIKLFYFADELATHCLEK